MALEARIPKPTVIHYLGELQCTGAVDLVGHLLLTDPNPAIRDAAASALGQIGTSEAVSYLLKVLETETHSAHLDSIHRALAQPRFLCELIEALPLTRPILTDIALLHQLRIFADGRVMPPNGPSLPCREAMQGLIS
ncbi:MAG: HEAT repeat domain-containing protein [Anaerolineales bacterium]|nr:HEAT repeat domain-containing protein [Anaerolineales bacterium]